MTCDSDKIINIGREAFQPSVAAGARLIVVSGRVPRPAADYGSEIRPSGGVEALLAPLANQPLIRWVSPGRSGPGSVRLTPEALTGWSDRMCSGALWFVMHSMTGFVRRIDPGDLLDAWAKYVAVNECAADDVVRLAAKDETVMVNDYQFMLVPGLVRARRPDLRVVYVHYTPYPEDHDWDGLPSTASAALKSALTDVSTIFLSRRWRGRFCAAYGPTALAHSRVLPVSPDPVALHRAAESPGVRAARDRLRRMCGSRALVVTLERLDPVKGGIDVVGAVEDLARQHTAAFLYSQTTSTRQAVQAYSDYRAEYESAHRTLNCKALLPDEPSSVLHVGIDGPGSLACLLEYDVLVVNSVADGLNLVALEGLMLNEQGSVVLSSACGAAELVGDLVHLVHPRPGTPPSRAKVAAAISNALRTPVHERRRATHLARQRLADIPHGTAWLSRALDYATTGEADDVE